MQTKDWIILVLVILCIVLVFFTFFFKNKYNDADNTIIIMNDSIEVYKNKYKEEYTAKNMYILKAE